MNYGRFFENFSSDAIKSFLYDMGVFKKSLKHYHQEGNQVLFKKVATALKQFQ
jgi:hypothetical protein